MRHADDSPRAHSHAAKLAGRGVLAEEWLQRAGSGMPGIEMAFRWNTTSLGVYWLLISACLDPESSGALVPPTAAEDPALPRVRLPVDEQPRWLHVETTGEPQNPVLLVLPGGPGADFRLLRPLQELSDDYFVVLWDQHGCGLSERVNHARELTLDSFDAEIDAVRAHYAGDRKVTLIGHSFGGSIATRYAALHPEQVNGLILFEPGPLTVYAREHRGTRTWLSVSTVQRVLWGNEVLTAQDHAQADYRLLGVFREATEGFNCPGAPTRETPMWRFGAFAYEMVLRAEHDMDYAQHIERFTAPALMIFGTCSDLSADFQRAYNVPVFDHIQIEQFDGAGHSDMFLEYAARSVERVRSFLKQEVGR